MHPTIISMIIVFSKDSFQHKTQELGIQTKKIELWNLKFGMIGSAYRW
jgi:hypothetical protein